MLSQLKSMSVLGLDAHEIQVEVDITGGLPGITIVGLPDQSVNESKERVRSAIKNAGFEFPSRKITINLAPADIRKEGPAFDLPIAIGILAASEQLDCQKIREFTVVGELSLDGTARVIDGILPMAIEVKKWVPPQMIVPWNNRFEATLVNEIDVYPVKGLKDAVDVITGRKAPAKQTGDRVMYESGVCENEDVDFSDVKGHKMAKRALEIAASGHHNILMIGPPGAGKTMLARRLPSILPPMNFEESLDVTKIYSILGLLPRKKPLITKRPFRSPHHSASYAGLVGGGSYPKPGEISLAHHGVLFLDELPEFRKDVLEMLRQPLEEGRVVISRAHNTICYPASFMLVASMNPCPCGYYMDNVRKCECSGQKVKKYISRLSGPLLDRIDVHIEVPRLEHGDLFSEKCGENSDTIRNRVITARKIQIKRFVREGIKWNVHMNPADIKRYCALNSEASDLLREAVKIFGLSARAFSRILKLSRTIADMDGKDNIETLHVAEAIQYRMLDREKPAA